MAERRPRIGVTGPDRGGAAAWWFTRLALFRAGARARRLRPKRWRDRSVDPLDGLDGVVVGGGADVDPARYGEELVPPESDETAWRDRVTAFVIHMLRRLLRLRETPRRDPARDEFETAVLASALERGLPVLGICRGAQLLAVHLGGRLAQDLRDFYTERPNPRTPLPRKRVMLEPGSRLRAILGTDSCRVNALHDQAIAEPGPHLRVTAREANGVTQAVEHDEREFVIGVQWHPEYLPQLARQQRLFHALTRATKTY